MFVDIMKRYKISVIVVFDTLKAAVKLPYVYTGIYLLISYYNARGEFIQGYYKTYLYNTVLFSLFLICLQFKFRHHLTK